MQTIASQKFRFFQTGSSVSALGLTATQIGETIQTAIEGSIPTQLQRGNRLVDVRVQLNEASVQAPSQLERLPLFVDNNRQIRLSDVAKIAEGQAPGRNSAN